MFNWLREYLNIKYEFRERAIRLKKESAQSNIELDKEEEICQSCETLRQQLEIANYEKGQLLSKILKEPEVPKETQPPQITRPTRLPWPARRQLLEQEDREKARLIRSAPKPDATIADVAELEKDLKVAEVERENQTVATGTEQSS